MKTKSLFSLIILLFTQLMYANMASPIRLGTITSDAFSSKDINILSESIFIKFAPEFRTAKFIVEYNIQTSISGKQIPLLFYAEDYKDSFTVAIDNKNIPIQNLPDDYTTEKLPNYGNYNIDKQNEEVSIKWNEEYINTYKLSELKYFEIDIPKGKHKITVTYTADAWTDVSDWVNKYSFFYSLTPAKYWKSFGTLHLTIEQEGEIKQLSTNIGLPIEQTYQKQNNWQFDKLPAEYLEFSYKPTPNKLATKSIETEPSGIALIIGVLLSIIHFVLILFYRKKHPEKKHSLVVSLGSILVPLLFIATYIYSFEIIDNIIGIDAGKHHGYGSIFAILSYPILLIIYWFLVWIFDRILKWKFNRIP